MKNRLSITVQNRSSRPKISIKTNDGIPSKPLELVRLRVAQIHQCPDSIEKHQERLKALGETERRLQELEVWVTSTVFNSQERAALALCEKITLNPAQSLPDHLIQEMRHYFTKSDIVNLCLAILAANDWNFFDDPHPLLSETDFRSLPH